MDLIQFAQSYSEEGLNPLPLKKDKAPLLPVGHSFLYSKIDRIQERFSKAAMIGIACGPVSDGFYCIDFDKHQGQNIDPIWYDFFENPTIQHLIRNGHLVCAKTPSGGYHAYFKADWEMKGTVFSRYEDGNTMIEMRGHGQYVATLPSEGYTHIAGIDFLKLEKIDLDAFSWLDQLCKSYNQITVYQSSSDRDNKKWPDKWDEYKPDGIYNNTKGEETKALLQRHGWKKICNRRDGSELWQRPGKEVDQGASATFGVKFNMFYVFSSNALPFQQNTAYNPFQVLTMLEFGGDWKKAKKAITPRKEIKEDAEPRPSTSKFPIDVFPPFLQQYIAELKSTLNFHEDFSAVSAMFTMATVNGNYYKLKVKNGWNAPTIFWFACVGYPGTIKTHPVRNMINPIYEIDARSKAFYDSEMEGWDPDAKPKKPKPKFRQILISDYTIEALHAIHDFNKRGIGLYKDELVGFLNDMNKYRKGSDEQFWLESINNGNYTVNRVSKEPIMIKNICINIIGTIQHDVLDKVIANYSGNGLIDRFLFTASENKVYPLSTNEIDEYFSEFFNEIIAKASRNWTYFDQKDEKIIEMTPEAFEAYRKIDAQYVALQTDDVTPQQIKSYLSKMKTYVPRFALLLAIMDSIFNDMPVEVTEKHMYDAGRIGQYFILTAMDIFTANDVQSQIRRLVSTMQNKTRTDQIIELYNKDFKQSDLARFFGISRQAISKALHSAQP